MGLIQSLLCSVSFCIERIMTWSFCALLLMLLMLSNLLLIVYGISVGYHYAQKEITDHAMLMRTTTTEKPALRNGSEISERQLRPLQILVNKNEALLRNESNSEDDIFIKISDAPVVSLETERSLQFSELDYNQLEKELAHKLFESLRRRGNNATISPYIRQTLGDVRARFTGERRSEELAPNNSVWGMPK